MLGICPPLEESGPLAPTVSTPLFVMVTLPTPPLFTLMPAPAALLNTPVLLTVTELPRANGLPLTPIPAPGVTVTELCCNAELGILLTFAPEIPVSPEPSPENECAATLPATST